MTPRMAPRPRPEDTLPPADAADPAALARREAIETQRLVREAKLPVWVRRELAYLRSRLAELERELATTTLAALTAAGKSCPDSAPIVAVLEGAALPRIGLSADTAVDFHTPGGRYTVTHEQDGLLIEVFPKYGSGTGMAIVPVTTHQARAHVWPAPPATQ